MTLPSVRPLGRFRLVVREVEALPNDATGGARTLTDG
jgi:hypothetical protein